MNTEISGSCPTKKKRRTRQQMNAIRGAIIDVLEEIQPTNLRALFYQLSTRKIVAKTEQEYKGTVGRLLTKMRRAGEVPFGHVVDYTRWQRKPKTYSGIEQLLNSTARLYRRDLWDNQDVYVEIWLEKAALSGVFYDITAKYDVPLMVSSGFSSVTFLHSAAEAILDTGKPAFLFQFGDHDPSGACLAKKIESDLRTFAPGAEIHFERIAVTPAQIEKYNLPTRPTKKSDSRAKKFKGESVELDAIDPNELRRLVEDCITQHIDDYSLQVTKAAEESEREWLMQLAERGVA